MLLTRRDVLKQSLAALPLASLVTQGLGHGHVDFEKPPEDLREGELQNVDASVAFDFRDGLHVFKPYQARIFLWKDGDWAPGTKDRLGLVTQRFRVGCTQPLQMMKTSTGHVVYYNHGAAQKTWGADRLLGPTPVMRELIRHDRIGTTSKMSLCLTVFNTETDEDIVEFELRGICIAHVGVMVSEKSGYSLCESVSGYFEDLVQVKS